MLKLEFEKIDLDACAPQRAHAGDAGLDLFSVEEKILKPNERCLVKTGIKIKLPDGCAGFVWDKSGVAKNGVHCMAGVIDAGYRGEILVSLINLSSQDYQILIGQKIAQLIIQKIETPELVEVKIENNTTRGEQGFGSSGLR